MLSVLANLNTGLYIDPSTVSILLTSISGVVVAIGATAVIIWRRLKKGVAKVLNIDENKGKDVEEDVVIYDEESGESAAEEKVEDSEQTETAATEGTEEQ